MPLAGEFEAEGGFCRRTKGGVCKTERSRRWSPRFIIEAALGEERGGEGVKEPGETLCSLSNL